MPLSLEDHLGDIIRKARAMTNISSEAAARAAGLTEPELAALEETGQTAKEPDFAALADLIGLHPAKLESIAKGWLPAQTDESKWCGFRRITTTANGITVNCYLIWDEVSREAA